LDPLTSALALGTLIALAGALERRELAECEAAALRLKLSRVREINPTLAKYVEATP